MGRKESNQIEQTREYSDHRYLTKFGPFFVYFGHPIYHWVRFFGSVGRKLVVVHNRRGTRLIWITLWLTRYAHYRH